MEYINSEIKDHILHIRLNRPDVRNAFDPKMIDEITQVFSAVAPEVRAVVVSGEGESFCAGADLGWMKSMAEFSFDENQSDSLKLYDMFAAIYSCPVPVIAKVHGHVFGGALGIVAASDIAFAETSTLFAFSEVKIGLVPAVISDFIRKTCIMSRASRWMLSGERFGSVQAQDCGLIDSFGDSEQIDEKVKQLVKEFKKSGPQAVRATKKLLRDLETTNDSRALTASVIAEARVGDEGQEGLRAFFEKRKPEWV